MGADVIFVEELQVNPRITSKLICCIWKHCSGLRYLIRPWAPASMVSIYKRENPENPSSFRPIALLSHARKSIEAGIAKVLTDVFTFSDAQLTFQR